MVTRVACWKVSSSVSAPVARRRESAANLLSVLMVAHMHSALELRTSSLDRRCPTRTFLGCTGPSHQSFRYVLARVLNDPRLEWCGVAVVCVELTLALPWCMQGRDRCSQCSRCLHQKYGVLYGPLSSFQPLWRSLNWSNARTLKRSPFLQLRDKWDRVSETNSVSTQ